MSVLINDDFLIKNEISSRLYHEYAKDMPIFDYHCHIDPNDIAANRKYSSITELWLSGDHYKWRAMRANGVEEKYITGNASPKDKFRMWAYTMEYLIGNPLFHWAQLELKRYFGIDDILCRNNHEYIYDRINEMLEDDNFRCRNIIAASNVKVLCPAEDPLDPLDCYDIIRNSRFGTLVFPSFRPDKLYFIERDPYPGYIKDIEMEYEIKLPEFGMLLEFIEARIEYFHFMGCRISDHSVEIPVYEKYTYKEVSAIYKKKKEGKVLTDREVKKYKTAIMDFMGRQYSLKDWAMQLHIGVRRNLNSRMYGLLGPDAGFDGISDEVYMPELIKMLDMLDRDDRLPKTIIYCLNPRDNEMIASSAGCFQRELLPGKIQFGAAWWFNDTREGIERQLIALSGIGLLSRSIGMTTDSRSILSYTRHEYFRRILCSIIGRWAEEGDIPKDMDLLGRIVSDISFNNAENYFKVCLKS